MTSQAPARSIGPAALHDGAGVRTRATTAVADRRPAETPPAGDHLARPHTPAPGAPQNRRLHLTGLDGLRALAVVSVLAYHAGAAGLPGGFLGVDLFLAISGFLITTLILTEVERTGRLRVGAFYGRRARRLLPALYLVLGAVVAIELLLRDQLDHLRRAVPAALLYVSNWFQVASSESYFDAQERPSLLRHLWTLAVEAQFYLLAPLLAWAAIRWGRHRLGKALLVLAALSATAMVVLAVGGGMPVSNDPTRVYVGTDTHAFPLLLGAALACVWRPWRLRGAAARSSAYLCDVAAVVGLAAFAALVIGVSERSTLLYRGGYAVAAVVCVVLVGAVVHPQSAIGRALDRHPLRWIGTRSYGIYLWHWPVLMVTRAGVDLPWAVPVVAVLQVSLTCGLAELSWRFVETPVRRGALLHWWRSVRTAGPLAVPARRTTAVLAIAALAVVGLGSGLAHVPERPSLLETSDRLVGGGGVVTAPDGGAGAGAGAEAARTPVMPGVTVALGPDGTPAALAPQPAAVPQTHRPAPEPAPEPAPVDEVGAITVVGDSVMGMVAPDLAALGPVTVDWKVSRQFREMADIVLAMRDAGTLGRTVVVHGGSNGPIAEADLRRVLDALSDHRVFLVNDRTRVEYQDQNNALLASVVPQYPNARVIDWYAYSDPHGEWFFDDATHPREGTGSVEMANLVWTSIQSGAIDPSAEQS